MTIKCMNCKKNIKKTNYIKFESGGLSECAYLESIGRDFYFYFDELDGYYCNKNCFLEKLKLKIG